MSWREIQQQEERGRLQTPSFPPPFSLLSVTLMVMGLHVELIFRSWNMGSIFCRHALFSDPCAVYVLPRFNCWILITLSVGQVKLSWCSARACQPIRGTEPHFSTPVDVQASGQFYTTVVMLCTSLIGSCVYNLGRDYENCLSFQKYNPHWPRRLSFIKLFMSSFSLFSF